MNPTLFFFTKNAVFLAVLLLLCGVSAAATEKVLYKFIDGTGGKYPESGLTLDSQGNLYGTASEGGVGGCSGIDGPGSNCGVVFKLTRTQSGWTKSVLYRFKGQADGSSPQGGMVFDPAGNLYGVTTQSGIANCGTVFKLVPTVSGEWKETILHNFQGDQDGCIPSTTPLLDKSGNLYGATLLGGRIDVCPSVGSTPAGCGVVFKLTPAQDGSWSKSTLVSFKNKQEGGYPAGDLSFDNSGNLWGTTEQGGVATVCGGFFGNGLGCGVVFILAPAKNGQWSERVIYKFSPGPTDGAIPQGGVAIDPTGNVFVTSSQGGAHAVGGVVELTPKARGGFSERLIVSFGAVMNNCGSPSPVFSRVIFDSSGNLFGLNAEGGKTGSGNVFQLTPKGDGTWTETILYQFPLAEKNGFWPFGDALARDAGGTLYGTTIFGGHVGPQDQGDGVVFEVTP